MPCARSDRSRSAYGASTLSRRCAPSRARSGCARTRSSGESPATGRQGTSRGSAPSRRRRAPAACHAASSSDSCSSKALPALRRRVHSWSVQRPKVADRMLIRLSLRLPITIALLLSTLIAAFAMLAYNEMRALAEAQYSSRVRMASEQIARTCSRRWSPPARPKWRSSLPIRGSSARSARRMRRRARVGTSRPHPRATGVGTNPMLSSCGMRRGTSLRRRRRPQTCACPTRSERVPSSRMPTPWRWVPSAVVDDLRLV